jgi:hypothetical protein
MPRGAVEVAPLREAFLRSDRTAADVARELGWTTRRNVADGPRVRRVLGLRPYTTRSGGKRYTERCDESTAVNILRALNLDPWEVGL